MAGVDVTRLCRLCAEENDTDDNIFSMNEHVNFVEVIDKYLSITITLQDDLPINVCQKCRDQVILFDKFHYMCTETQITLQTLLGDSFLNKPALSCVKTELKSDVDLMKIENSESISIKAEIDSDNCNDDNDDYIPISQYISKRKLNKKKSKSDHCKKIKRSHSERKKSVDNFDEDFDEETSETNLVNQTDIEPQKKERKRRDNLINNSFVKFFCHICNSNFSNWCALKTHAKNEHNVKAKVLCVCDKYLYTRHSINRHIVKHDATAGIKCESCNKTFSTTKALQSHSTIHLPKDQYPHVCSHCAKRFATSLTLKIHEKTHIPKEMRYIHPCNICGIKFTSKSSVKAHISAVHEKLRPFVCDICGHAFNNKGNLLEHRVLHSDEKLHCCPKCPKRFKTKGTLQRHIDCHGSTSYKCAQCPAILNSRRTLRMHMYVHEDLCRYLCALCNKSYKRRKSLKSHMNIHTGERPYSCPWCSRTFADNSNCRIHKRRMHPVELAHFEATHGVSQDITKDELTEERKLICNMTFKLPDTKPMPIIMPQLDIKPLVPEMKNLLITDDLKDGN